MTQEHIVSFLDNLPVELKNPKLTEPPKYSNSENEIYFDYIGDGGVLIKL